MVARKAARKVERADRKASDAAAVASENVAVRALGTLSEIGDQPPLRALCAATIAAGVVRRDRKLALTGVRMLAAHTLATWLKTRVKRSVDRTRPDHAADHGYRMETGDSHEHALSSFPSGHTAGAVAVAEAFAREYPEHALAARAAAAVVSLVQVPRAKHFVGDVAVGALIGFVAERAIARAVAAPAISSAPFEVALPPGAALRTGPKAQTPTSPRSH